MIEIPTGTVWGILTWKEEPGKKDQSAFGKWRFPRVSMDDSVHAICDDLQIVISDIDLKLSHFEPKTPILLEGQTGTPLYMTVPPEPSYFVEWFGEQLEIRVENGKPWVKVGTLWRAANKE